MAQRSQRADVDAQGRPQLNLNSEEFAAYVACSKSLWFANVLPPTLITGAFSYAIALQVKARRPLFLAGLGGAVGWMLGGIKSARQCQEQVIQKFPDGEFAKNMRRMRNREQPHEMLGAEQPVTSQQRAQQRMTEDYQGGFADTHNNVQYKGLAEENRRTVDNDGLLPINPSGPASPPPRPTYDDLRKEHRAQYEGQGAKSTQDEAFRGIFSPQNQAQENRPKPSIASLENLEPRKAPPKPVRRNQYGDIIEE